jgi:hypothetical protein
MTLALTNFGVAAAELGLTLEQQTRAKALAAVLKVGLDDPDAYRLAAIIKTEGTHADFLEKLEALIADLGNRTEEANDDLARKASALIANIEKKTGSVIEEKMKGIPLSLSAEAEKVFRSRLDEVIRKVNDDRDKTDFRFERFRVGLLGVGVAVVVLFVGGWAYTLGNDNRVSTNARVEAILARPDAGAWMLAAENNDFRAVVGSCQGFERQGRKMGNCELGFDKPLTSSVGTDALRLLWTEIQVKLGGIGLLASGLLLGAAGAMWFGRKKTA